MLQGMQQQATSVPSANPASFAGLLASLTAPAKKPAAAWSDEGLADDFATISYESALRSHARPRVPDPADHAPIQTATPVAGLRDASKGVASPAAEQVAEKPVALKGHYFSRAEKANKSTWASAPEGCLPLISSGIPSFSADSEAPFPPHALASCTDAGSEAPQNESTTLDRNLKSSSITIRLSKTECAQLRKRAAEAGVTVSAYLRSCTFEAESLRAQVKETLAELRLASSRAEQNSSPQPRQFWPRWVKRMFPPWHGGQRSAPA